MTGPLIFAAAVSLASLLGEMTDRDAMTYAPDHRARMWSSCDRSNVMPGLPGWFANFDRNNFLFHDYSRGRIEQVMVDAKGPGAVTRLWLVTNNDKSQGTLRIYVDGILAAEGPALDLAGTDLLAPRPLAAAVPQSETRRVKQGNNLYLPIPYAKSCRITFEEAPDRSPLACHHAPPWFYYNIETREYGDREVRVEGPSRRSDADEAAKVLALGCGDPLPPGTRETDLPLALKAGESAERAFDGPNAIRALTVEFSESDAWLLQDLVVTLTFDGRETASVPIGGLFAAGRVAAPHETWFTKVSESTSHQLPPSTNLHLHCRYVMPFAREGRVRFTNAGTNALAASVRLAVGPYRWDAARSMHFGATAKRFEKVKVSPAEACDLTFADLKGEGVIFGTCLSVDNRSTSWWGEGDEKVFVDGEILPSYVGTGSEDYFGFAHGSPRTFSHPFLAQPVGEGAYPKNAKRLFKAGPVECCRFRALDAIPFHSGCRFDFEVLDEGGGELDLLATTLWYGRGEAASPIASQRSLKILSPPSTFDSTLAARAFAKYAKQMTGREAEIVSSDDGKSDLVRFALLPDDGTDTFTIASAPWANFRERRMVLTISGTSARCCRYAVYAFFERHGCRWFRDRERVPKVPSLQLTGWNLRETARFRNRVVVCKGAPPEDELLVKMRIGAFRQNAPTGENGFVLPPWTKPGVRADYDDLRKDIAKAALDPSVDTIVFADDFNTADPFAVRFFSESAWDPGVADVLPQFLRRFCFDRYGKDQPKIEPRWHAALANGTSVDERQ